MVLEQESYVPSMKKVIKKILQTTALLISKRILQNLHCNPQESHVKNLRCNNRWKQISCYQKRTILHTLSTICGITNMSNILNKQLSFFLDFIKAFNRVDLDFIFSALHKFGYRNKFINRFKLLIPIPNLKLK